MAADNLIRNARTRLQEMKKFLGEQWDEAQESNLVDPEVKNKEELIKIATAYGTVVAALDNLRS